MATDPVLYAAINNLKEPIGAARIVPLNFSSASYLDAGSIFKSEDYPDLAKVLPTGCQGTFFTKINIPTTTNSKTRIAISDDGTKIVYFLFEKPFYNQSTPYAQIGVGISEIWASDDGGSTWTHSSWTSDNNHVWTDIVADRNNGFVLIGCKVTVTSGYAASPTSTNSYLITSTSTNGIDWNTTVLSTLSSYYPDSFLITKNNTWICAAGGNPSFRRLQNDVWTIISSAGGVAVSSSLPPLIISFKDFLIFSNANISSTNSIYTYVSNNNGNSLSVVYNGSSAAGYIQSFFCNKIDCIAYKYSSTKSLFYATRSRNGVDWITISTDLDLKPYVKPTIGMENFFLSTSETSTTVNRSFNGGDTWDYYAPIYVDGVINNSLLSSNTCTNFDKTICCISVPGENYILRSVDSTYNTYKVLAPATSTTPGTKVVIRAK